MNSTLKLDENYQKKIGTRKLNYPRLVSFLFYLFALFLVIPFFDIPLLILSLSAPVFFIVAIVCILRPPAPWLRRYASWIVLAAVLLVGIFTSTWANGLLSGGKNIDSSGISIVIHYAYWLLVFVVTAYFFTPGQDGASGNQGIGLGRISSRTFTLD